MKFAHIVDDAGLYPREEDLYGDFYWTRDRFELFPEFPAKYLYLWLCFLGETGELVISDHEKGLSFALQYGWHKYFLDLTGLAIHDKISLAIPQPYHSPQDPRVLGIMLRDAEVFGNLTDAAIAKRTLVENEKANAGDFDRREIVIGSTPPRVRINIETRCNIQPPCVYCDWTHMKQMETYAQFQFTLDTIRELGDYYQNATELVDCSIGEPLLSPDFVGIIKQFDRDRKHFEFTTNGILLNRQMQDALLGKDIFVAVSLDAATPERYRRFRNDRFPEIIHNLRELCRRKREHNNFPKVIVSFIAMQSNQHEVYDFMQLCKSIGVDVVKIRFLDTDNTLMENSVDRNGFHFNYRAEMLPTIRIHNLIARIRQFAAEQEIMVLIDYPEPGTNVQICDEPWKALYYFKRGILPCCYGRRPFVRDIPQNLSSRQLIQYVYNSREFQDLRKILSEGRFPPYCLETNCPLVKRRAMGEAGATDSGKQEEWHTEMDGRVDVQK